MQTHPRLSLFYFVLFVSFVVDPVCGPLLCALGRCQSQWDDVDQIRFGRGPMDGGGAFTYKRRDRSIMVLERHGTNAIELLWVILILSGSLLGCIRGYTCYG